MTESKEKPIKGLKIKYDGKTYESITYFSISNWDGNERVSFTEKKDNTVSTTVNCKYSDIKIVQSSDN